MEKRVVMAADGLDAGFGDAGQVMTVFDGYATANAILQQPDGKLVVAGGINHAIYSQHTAAYDFALARYNLDGSLDPTFGSGGMVDTPSTVIAASGAALARQPDGKYLVVGSGGDFDFIVGALARYNADGSLDATFGDAGKVIVHDASYSQVAVQADGKILVGGSVLRRYNADGSLDTSFGSGGTVNYDVQKLLLEAGGKILVAGTNGELHRYLSDGSLDSTFGNAGVVSSHYLTESSLIAFDNQGNILWGGRISNADGTQPFQLERLSANGRLDKVLAVIPPDSGTWQDFTGLAVQADGKIVLAGTQPVLQEINGQTPIVLPESRYQAVRLNADGTRDASFGTDGEEQTSFGPNYPARVMAVAIQQDGQIVLAGGAGALQVHHFALARISTNFDQSYVDHLYLDLLGRAADPAGESFFTNALSQGQLDRAQIAARLIASDEYHAHETRLVYEKYLRREPDAAGLAYWRQQLDSGVSLVQLEASVLGSDEYFHAQGGGTNAGYVAALYHDLLSRDVDPGAAQSWGRLLAAGDPRAAIAASILSSQEFALDEVSEIYPALLNRTPDASGLDYFRGLLSAGVPVEVVTRAIVASREYYTGV